MPTTSDLEPSLTPATDPNSSQRLQLVRTWFAPAVLAIALIGFWLYLGFLAVIGVAPRTALTGVYYTLLGCCLWPLVWRRRALLRARVEGSNVARVFAVAATLLFVWFAIDAVVAGRTTLAHRLAAQLVLWTAPAAALAAALTVKEVERLLRALACVGGTFAVLELAMLWRGSVGGRYSPLAHLDSISAAQYAAVALLAVLALDVRSGRAELLRAAVAVLLVFGVVVPGSRGPFVGVALAVALLLVTAPRSFGLQARAATALLLAVATAGAFATAVGIGSSGHLTSGVPGVPGKHQPSPRPPHGKPEPTPPAASSDQVRIALLKQALRRSRTNLVLGNGVGTLADESAVAKRIGLAGCCTYPHNEPVEALYSLGVGGLVLYVIAIAAGAWMFAGLFRRAVAGGRTLRVSFVLAFAVYAFVQSEVSGEIAEDIWIWVAAGLLLTMRWFTEERP